MELLGKNSKDWGKEVYYWKNKRECDFLIKERDKKRFFQVCFNLSEPEIKERETKGIMEAMKNFKAKDGTIITQDFEGEEKIKGKIIKFIPLWEWLLAAQ